MADISQDEGWREIQEAIIELMVSYGVNREDAYDFTCDVETDINSVIREKT